LAKLSGGERNRVPLAKIDGRRRKPMLIDERQRTDVEQHGGIWRTRGELIRLAPS